ncbi:MAG: hypothetical protein ABI462_10830, partial [Ignavibacteria bacterium]
FKTYAEKINYQKTRSGSLFLKPFRRKIITNDNYFKRIIFYIHYNPVHHKISESFVDYKWSSYKRIIDPKKTNLEKTELISMFDGIMNFIDFHKDMCNLKKIAEFVIE